MLKRKKERLDCENSQYFAQNLLMHTETAYSCRKTLFCQAEGSIQGRMSHSKKKSD